MRWVSVSWPTLLPRYNCPSSSAYIISQNNEFHGVYAHTQLFQVSATSLGVRYGNPTSQLTRKSAQSQHTFGSFLFHADRLNNRPGYADYGLRIRLVNLCFNVFHHQRVQFKTHNNCQTFSCLISLDRYIHSEPQNHHPRQERPPCSKCSWRLNGPTEKICTCDPQIAHRLDKVLQYKIQFVCFLSVCLLN